MVTQLRLRCVGGLAALCTWVLWPHCSYGEHETCIMLALQILWKVLCRDQAPIVSCQWTLGAHGHLLSAWSALACNEGDAIRALLSIQRRAQLQLCESVSMGGREPSRKIQACHGVGSSQHTAHDHAISPQRAFLKCAVQRE